MSQFTADQQSQIKQLAMTYSAFIDAVNREDDAAIRVWSDILQRHQNHVGVEIVADDKLIALGYAKAS